MLHDRHDRLLALADRDQIEVVDEGFGLAGRVWPADHRQGLATDLVRERERLVLHRDHAVDADDGWFQAIDLCKNLVPLEKGVVDMTHRVARMAERSAEVHEAE